MIQRLQTIYLIIVVAIAGSLLYANPTYFETEGVDKWTNGGKGTVTVGFTEASWLVNDQPVRTFPLQLLTYTIAVIGALALVAVFMFKNRQRQLMLCGVNFVIMLLLLGFMSYYAYNFSQDIAVPTESGIATGLFFPLFLPIINYMAIKRIRMDEELIRSMDRLR